MHFDGVDLNNDNVTTGERSEALYEDAEYVYEVSAAKLFRQVRSQ